MTRMIRQSLALGAANLRSLPRRRWTSASMVLSIALVVLVLLGFLAMANGFRASLQATGSDRVAIALGTGASTELGSRIEPAQLHLLEDAPGVARDAEGRAVISRELVVPVDAPERGTGYLATLSLRGVGEHGLAVRPDLEVTDGRMVRPGAAEIVVGRRAAEGYQGLEVGQEVAFGTARWTVVGMFEAGGSVLESELLADAEAVRARFAEPALIQSARILLEEPGALGTLVRLSEEDARIALPIRSEAEYFAAMAQGTTRLVMFLGWPLAVTMALGAAVGALTTMHASVSDRSVEIATVRTLGFSRGAALVATWIEAMVLTAVGCAVGVALAYLVLDGWSASTTGADQTQIGFELALAPGLVLQAVILSLAIGAVGGGLPALGATRLPLRLAMTGRA